MDRTNSSIHSTSQNTTGTETPGSNRSRASWRPTVHGPLPYTEREYLRQFDESPAMDFLILGSLPVRRTFDGSDRTSSDRLKFSAVASECIRLGEWDALRQLAEETGVDLNKLVLHVDEENLTQAHAQKLYEACSIYPGMQFDLKLYDAEPETVRPLSNLIAWGKVRDLNIMRTHSSVEMPAGFLLPVAGQITGELKLRGVALNADDEAILAESLANSTSLVSCKLDSVEFKDGQGALLVDGLKRNCSISDLELKSMIYPRSILSTGYPLLLSHNTHLENLRIGYAPLLRDHIHDELTALFAAAKENKTLHRLEVSSNSSGTLLDTAILNNLLEKNSSLTELQLNFLICFEDVKSLAESLKKNRSLTKLSIPEHQITDAYNYDDDIIEDLHRSIQETLARNRRINSAEMMRAAGMAFDPDGTTGFTDPGSVIARHILANAPTVEAFADTMAAIELSMKELGKQAASTPTPTSTPVGITMTTDSTSSNTATTTTTTITTTTSNGTDTHPRGPASS